MTNRRIRSGLAIRIDAALEHSGLTARGASLRAGLGGTYVSNMRRGIVTSPGIVAIEALARVLGVRPAWLAWGDGPMVEADSDKGDS